MKIKLLILLFLASLSTYAQYTLIPDVNFENKLISLGIDSGVADGKVLTVNVASLTSLNVSSSSISDLTGIQDFVALQTLNCSGNKLTTIDLSKNTALIYLDCKSNQLNTLDLSKNTSLTVLHCYSNKLTSLNVSENIVLEDLSCFSNLLTTLDVSKNIALTLLWCSTNPLTTLDVTRNTVLNTLYCDSNQLTSLDVSKNTALTQLTCVSNQLKTLDVAKNILLTWLYCDSNQLTSLNLSKNPALNDFKSNNNTLVDLNLKNGKNTLLNSSTLNFKGNPNLICIQVDDPDYSNANWADKKDVTANYNVDCTPYTLIPDVNFENKLIALGIDSGVADGKVPTANVDRLTSLDVSLSSIADLTGIQDFKSLKELVCTANYLTTLDISKNLALLSLQCNVNKLSALDVSKNLSLQSLKCSHNHITSLDVSNNIPLQTLMCDTNQLTDLNVSKNLELSVLLFDYNKLTTINVSTNTSLNTLGFSFNNLTSIDVSKNNALSFLNCQSNQFIGLDVSHNLQLSTLYCNDNQITTLDVSKNGSLSYFFCQNNKLLHLNIKNGNQTHFANNYLDFTGNPSLTCIQVDDVTYANTNWANVKDVTANYNVDCTPYTLIPNSSFEQKLIDLGIDTDGLNGKISTTSIESISSLDLSNTNITDLTGIENFTALKYFTANGNNLTSVDFSKNLMLQYISISGNNLTSLDVSNNANLSELDFSNNKVMQIDLSQNKELTVLNALGNQLTSLDISQNPKIKSLNVEFNQLASLNLQNGNNANFVLAKPTTKKSQTVVYTSFLNNKNLSCIQVDNVAYSNANWTNIKDATATYSSTCSKLGIEDSVFDKVIISPNPTKGELHINNIVLEKATVYDALGKLVKTTTFTSGTKDNKMHLEGFPSGIYYIYLESDGANTAKKIIVE